MIEWNGKKVKEKGFFIGFGLAQLTVAVPQTVWYFIDKIKDRKNGKADLKKSTVKSESFRTSCAPARPFPSCNNASAARSSGNFGADSDGRPNPHPFAGE